MIDKDELADFLEIVPELPWPAWTSLQPDAHMAASMAGDRIDFCEHCMDATDCKVVRGCGVTFWECRKCGRIVDEDFDDPYAEDQ